MSARLATAFLLGFFASSGAIAQETSMVLGGDSYAAGSNVTITAPTVRDLFLTGASVEVGSDVKADAHVAGFDVNVAAPVSGNLYAGGFSVDVSAPVGTDVTATAANFTLRQAAAVAGNVRVLAANATLDAPIAGSLLAAGGSVELNGTVAGDAVVTAGNMKFGPNARIDGSLTYYAEEAMQIPASVAAPERVRFVKQERTEAFNRIPMDMPIRSFWPAFLTLFSAFVMTIAFLVVVGALALSFAPQSTEQLRLEAAQRPFTSMLLGALGLAMLLGLVPVSAMTLFGIPLIPIAILAIVLAWIAGYLIGVYVVAWKVAGAFGVASTSVLARLSALTIGLVAFALLNFVPILGWLANLLVIFLGLGAFVKRGAVAVASRPAVPVTSV